MTARYTFGAEASIGQNKQLSSQNAAVAGTTIIQSSTGPDHLVLQSYSKASLRATNRAAYSCISDLVCYRYWR